MVEVIRRGEIWVANLNPSRGQEVGKIRPVLVFQDNALTAIGTPMIIILPITTQIYPAFKQWRITITARSRLLRDCQIIVINHEYSTARGLKKGLLPSSAKKKWFPLNAPFWEYVICFITLFIHVG